ncbi:MAG: tRNA 2-selenouridine(34) synthase MnmH [Pseudomonadota bacterium]
MIEAVIDVGSATLALHSAIIDVRSPAEFAEDHIPGAINLPVLSNEERAEVGTIYVQESRFRARRIGAAYVARNVARHLETALSERDAKFRPLLYCWRGGMRSNAMATILSEVGWRVGVLQGGYRTWRRAVVDELFESAAPLSLILIDGQTGAAKTEILKRMRSAGAQAIDLEELAAHKGSVFGGDTARAQPSQKHFESLLFKQLQALDPTSPIAVEAESSRIGRVVIPKRFWAAMRAAPRIEIRASAPARALYLVRAYAEFIAAPGEVSIAIDRLKPFHPKERIAEWQALAASGLYADLAARLIEEHYDPLYDRGRRRAEQAPIGAVHLDRLEPQDIDRAAAEALALIMAPPKRSPL